MARHQGTGLCWGGTGISAPPATEGTLELQHEAAALPVQSLTRVNAEMHLLAYPETLGFLRIIKSPSSPSGTVTMSGYLACEQKDSIGS